MFVFLINSFPTSSDKNSRFRFEIGWFSKSMNTWLLSNISNLFSHYFAVIQFLVRWIRFQTTGNTEQLNFLWSVHFLVINARIFRVASFSQATATEFLENILASFHLLDIYLFFSWNYFLTKFFLRVFKSVIYPTLGDFIILCLRWPSSMAICDTPVANLWPPEESDSYRCDNLACDTFKCQKTEI